MRQHLLLICVLGCALFSLISTLKRRSELPTRSDWEAVVYELSQGLQRGDAVTWLPEWAEEGRLALKAVEGRAEVLYPPHHGALDLARFKRVWVIGALGHTASGLVERSALKGEARRAALNHEVLSEQRLKLLGERPRGRLSLGLIERQGERVHADLFQDLSDPSRVTVRRRSMHTSRVKGCELWALRGWHCELRRATVRRALRVSGSPTAREAQGAGEQRLVDRCLERPLNERLKGRSKDRALYSLDRRRHLSYVDCGLHPEEHVSRDQRVIGGEPRRCVWLHPHRASVLELTWRTEAPPDARLVLRYGWEDLAVDPPFRRSSAQPLTLTLSGLSREAPDVRLDLQPRLGWRTEVVSLPPGPLARQFTLSLTAPKGTRDANLCVEFSVRIEKP